MVRQLRGRVHLPLRAVGCHGISKQAAPLYSHSIVLGGLDEMS
jgi:hypothetical protein